MRFSPHTLAFALWTLSRLYGQTDVLTVNYDNNRTSANLNETTLTAGNVSPSQFGKLFALVVDGQVYAQPLYVHGLAFPNKGVRNALFVATMHNSVYAFDADNGGAPLWRVNFGSPVDPRDFDEPNLPFKDIQDEIGILGTPVIDRASNTLYVVHYTSRDQGHAYFIHALDLVTGSEKFNGLVLIGGAPAGSGWAGLDDAANGQLPFDAGQHLQRPGLLLANGVVYVAFGSHGDTAPWHGWLMGYNASDLTQQTVLFNTSPSAAAASIWQGGRGPAADDLGNVYVVTGNGTYDGTAAWGESVLRLTADGEVADWFTPSVWDALNNTDSDLGSSGPILIPGTNKLLVAGKSGIGLLIDRTNMGHELPSDSQVLQSFIVSEKNGFAVFNAALWPRPDGAIAYFFPSGEPLSAFRMIKGLFETTPFAANSTITNARPVSGMTVSSNAFVEGSGVLWVTSASSNKFPAPGTLHALDATNPATELWNSDLSGGTDTLGKFSKFANPTVANGKVYVPTQSNQVVVYGLHPAPGIQAVVSGASYQGAPVSPGELISIFGYSLGPAQPLFGTVQPNGYFPTILGDVRVLFDNYPAPLLYAGPNQINLAVPYSAAGKAATQIRVLASGSTYNVTVPVAAVTPAFFSQDSSGTGAGAILNNADLSLNTAANPAPRGSVIAIYVTGLGFTTPHGVDGGVTSLTNPPLVTAPVAVIIGGVNAEVIYQGAAPGLISGLMQINARVPASIQPGPAVPVTLTAGTEPAQNTVTVAVK